MEQDLVKITCYGKKQVMKRKEAIKYFLDCMYCSEGSERERYTIIYLGLLAGHKVVSDEDY